MSIKSTRAKNSEYEWAEELRLFRIPAKRVVKQRFEKRPDVEIDGYTYNDKDTTSPRIILDSKYCERSWASSRECELVEGKYCLNETDFSAVYLRGYKSTVNRGDRVRVSIDSRLFAMLISFWLGFGTKEELWEIFKSKNKFPKKEVKDGKQGD